VKYKQKAEAKHKQQAAAARNCGWHLLALDIEA
jgi:hypothetical protein